MTADVTHGDVEQMDIREVVRRLACHLGVTLVAALAGVRDSRLPYRWAEPDGPTPSMEADARLRTAYRIWLTLTRSESDDTARSWFTGANPLLDGTAPFMALREGDSQKAVKAADAFNEGSWGA